jgi:hypothetical protein
VLKYIVTAAQLLNKEEQVHSAAEPSGLSHDYNTLCVGNMNLAFSTTCYIKKSNDTHFASISGNHNVK